jgi:hypothetical protein
MSINQEIYSKYYNDRFKLNQEAYSKYYNDYFDKSPLTFNTWYGTEIYIKYITILSRKRKLQKICQQSH